MSVADAQEVPTLDDLRKQLTALSDEISGLTGSGLGKVTAQMRNRLLSVALVALGIGLIGGYIIKR